MAELKAAATVTAAAAIKAAVITAFGTYITLTQQLQASSAADAACPRWPVPAQAGIAAACAAAELMLLQMATPHCPHAVE
jgi:hypothetical protein